MADALKRLGIDALSFANNHAFDRGGDGIVRTLQVLRDKGFAVTGAFADPAEDRVARFTLGDTRAAWIAYTATTNKKPETPEAEAKVNYLCRIGTPWMRPPYTRRFNETRELIAELLGRNLNLVERTRLCRILGEDVDYGDDCFDALDSAAGLQRLKADHDEARKDADVVLFYPHVGGQFNTKPGSFSQYIAARAVEMGFDAVLEAHSHTTQRARCVGSVPVFYSLGNVSMTHTVYTVEESLPQYGLAAHLYVEGGRIAKTAFSIIKMAQREGHRMEIWPVDELLESRTEDRDALLRETAAVWARVTGKTAGEFIPAREYAL
jgi:poly-gamma-glutamate synthesis protein (capsule biosynthesis protein)